MRQQLNPMLLRKPDQRLGDNAAVLDVDLVDGRGDLAVREEVREAVGGEFGDAELGDETFGVQGFEGVPGEELGFKGGGIRGGFGSVGGGRRPGWSWRR